MESTAQLAIFEQMSAIADTLRSRILLLLEGQELTVGELCAVLQAPQSTVSRHLRTLADGGWVASRPDGTRRLYHITTDRLDDDARALWSLARDPVSATAAARQDLGRLSGVLTERRSRSEEYFEGAAEHWDKVREELFGQRSYLLALLGLIDPATVVADLGCGTGAVADALAPAVARVIAVDGSEAMLDAARRRVAQHGNVVLRRGQLESVPIDDDAVDAATLILVLHHLPEPGRVIEEVRRILKPGGDLIILDMLPHDRAEYRQQMGHVWMGFDEARIRDLLERTGFDRIRHRELPAETAVRGPLLFAAMATAGAGRAR
jgi:ArsR family transcriptional regulator